MKFAAPAGPVSVRGVAVQKVDPLQQELELSADDVEGLRAHMRGVRAMDQTIFAKKDVSAAKARTMSSEALIAQTSKAALFVTYMLYDKAAIGVYRASLTAPSLMELVKRNDLGTAFAAAYRHMQLDPLKDRRFYADGGLMRLISTDTLVSYPPIRRKLAGHEREIIFAMAEKLAEAEKINSRFKPGKKLFGGTLSTVQAAARLLEQAAPKLKVDVMKLPNVDSAMREICSRAKTLER
ncbi:hypothetical protein [Fimbriimonas ginsengisoli]|nr:hypothetical protein [Fimbriimonas ginsengisoli]